MLNEQLCIKYRCEVYNMASIQLIDCDAVTIVNQEARTGDQNRHRLKWQIDEEILIRECSV